MSASLVQVSPTDNYMRAYVGPEGDVQMTWPKNLSLRGLDFMMESLTLQVNAFRDFARRETEQEEAARLEYESWFPATTKDQP